MFIALAGTNMYQEEMRIQDQQVIDEDLDMELQNEFILLQHDELEEEAVDSTGNPNITEF